jgi:hypothetical protein
VPADLGTNIEGDFAGQQAHGFGDKIREMGFVISLFENGSPDRVFGFKPKPSGAFSGGCDEEAPLEKVPKYRIRRGLEPLLKLGHLEWGTVSDLPDRKPSLLGSCLPEDNPSGGVSCR